jgi:hypothetical protein
LRSEDKIDKTDLTIHEIRGDIRDINLQVEKISKILWPNRSKPGRFETILAILLSCADSLTYICCHTISKPEPASIAKNLGTLRDQLARIAEVVQELVRFKETNKQHGFRLTELEKRLNKIEMAATTACISKPVAEPSTPVIALKDATPADLKLTPTEQSMIMSQIDLLMMTPPSFNYQKIQSTTFLVRNIRQVLVCIYSLPILLHLR